MAEAELDAAVIKRTQETLGKFVKKPPLTEKLLKKPPFRFLHDLFKAVIKDTGYFEGLYTADELNIDSIKDRDDKMRFLQKMIDVVKLTTENSLNVRTSKIVAGHEAEHTNELLQLMGEIIEKEMDWQKAVRAVTGAGVGGGDDGGETPANIAKKKDTNPKQKEKPKEKTQNNKTAKEIKTKEGQSKKSTPSPDDKNAKRTIKALPKEKVLSRQATVEKISKEKDKEKEKVTTKKQKESKDAAAKTKDERKKTTPSPVKPSPVTNKVTQNNNKENAKTSKPENGNASAENTEKLETKDTKESNQIQPKQSLPDNSPNLAEVEAKIEAKNLENGETLEPEARKSSASLARKSASSGKSRKSSASKQKSLESNVIENGQQNALESLKSLKAVNEEEVKAVNEPQAQQIMQSIAQPATQPTPAPKEIRREPTFTHENSRDSVGSNSNSSNTRPRTSLRPPSARPPSARPGAPRRRDRNVEIILQPNDQVKMSNVNVKLETFGDLDDDGENLVIIEDATTSSVDNILNDSNELGKLETDKLEQQGHLVQQILETQKELVQQNGEAALKQDLLEPGFDANTRQSSARQMNNLRDIIQSLTKSVNPFGKLMDFIPEDIDAMQLELNMWRDNYTQAASDLKREKSLTESATEPMKNQLIQIDANIKEYLEMIDASRVKILQNTEKISKMLLEQ